MEVIHLDLEPRRRILSANLVRNMTVNWPKKGVFRPRSHFLYMQLAGTRYMEDQEERFHMRPGDVILFCGGSAYGSYRPPGPYRAMNVLFECKPGDACSYLRPGRGPGPGVRAMPVAAQAGAASQVAINSRIAAAGDPVLQERFSQVVQLCNSPLDLRRRRAAILLEDLLLELALRSRPGAGRWSAPVEYVLGYIEKNLDQKLDLDALADLVGMSRRSLTRAFRAATGRSIVEYQCQKRVNMAASILCSQPRVRLRDIAATLGFYDEFHFGRVFRGRMGMAPGAYRRRCLEQEVAVMHGE